MEMCYNEPKDIQKGTQFMKYEDILAWWKKEKKDTKEDIYTLLDNFKILFAYHSGKIENETITLHDTREIFENGSVINYTGDLRTLFEIKNQKYIPKDAYVEGDYSQGCAFIGAAAVFGKLKINPS